MLMFISFVLRNFFPFSVLFTWLRNNYMKANTEKSHLLLSGSDKLTANIDGNVIESEDNQILLVITIDSNLSFSKHINNLCKKPASGDNEIINNISIWIWSIDLDLPQYSIK